MRMVITPITPTVCCLRPGCRILTGRGRAHPMTGVRGISVPKTSDGILRNNPPSIVAAVAIHYPECERDLGKASGELSGRYFTSQRITAS